MHILVMLVSAVGAAVYYFYFFKRAGGAASEVIDMAGRLRGKIRRNAFKNRVEGSVLTAVDDAGTAAAVLLTEIGIANGPLTPKARQEILDILINEIGMSDGVEVAPFAEWVCAQPGVKIATILKAFKPIWLKDLSVAQLKDLYEMGERVAGADSEKSIEKSDILVKLKKALSLQ